MSTSLELVGWNIAGVGQVSDESRSETIDDREDLDLADSIASEPLDVCRVSEFEATATNVVLVLLEELIDVVATTRESKSIPRSGGRQPERAKQLDASRHDDDRQKSDGRRPG